jgi:hypothetical protein
MDTLSLKTKHVFVDARAFTRHLPRVAMNGTAGRQGCLAYSPT